MDEMDNGRRPRRKRTARVSGRVRALLAGGLVLGVGATVTLAAWSDSEFATASFQAGTFNLQGSTDGTAFADHASAPGAALGFSVNATALSPGDVVYAPYAVRLAADTTSPATVTVTAPSTTGTVAGLSYRLIQPSSFGCTAATTGTTLVPAATAVGTVPGTVTFELAPGTPATNPGAAVNLCFVVTAGAGLTQSQAGTATWQFQASSH
jgi:predicted ribosomally synthesized peptide with SipW-like signal peptide